MDLCKLIENVDSKREVEKKAKEMTKNADASDKNSESEIGTEKEKNEATGKRKTDNGIIINRIKIFSYACVFIGKKKKRKLVDSSTCNGNDKKSCHSVKKAKMTAHHDAFKEIFQNEEIKRLREENERLRRVQESQVHQVNLFSYLFSHC